MTNNDAIDILRHLYLYKELEIPTERLKQALALAIKALEQEPKFIAKSDGTIEQIKNCDDCLFKKEWKKIGKLLSVVLEKQTEQEPCEAQENMTNREKFKEVFGFDHSIMECPFPSSICEKTNFQCSECHLFGWWEKEYKLCFKLREDLQ